jgi:DMSO/TMAO reductase YedYZ heme-binding membrane subunit
VKLVEAIRLAARGVHALAIIALAVLHPASYQEHTRSTSAGPGVIAYAFIVAMALTSSNKSVALIGARAWKILHTIGSLYLWVAFAKAFFIRTPAAALYWVPFGILIAALVLRVASWRTEARPSKANALR